MFELIIGSLLVPIAQKVGEKWIDRISVGIDEEIIKLFKGAARNTQETEKLIRKLEQDPVASKKIMDAFSQSLQNQMVTTALMTTSGYPKKGQRLVIYKSILESILTISFRLQRDLPIIGFFNDPNALTIFSQPENENVDISIINNSFLSFHSQRIQVKRFKSQNQLEKLYNELEKRSRMERNGMLGYFKDMNVIDQIYDHWVKYKYLDDYGRLKQSQKEEIEISSTDGLDKMLQSLRELLDRENQSYNDFLLSIEKFKLY